MRMIQKIVYLFINWDKHLPAWLIRTVSFVPSAVIVYSLYYFVQSAHFASFYENAELDTVSILSLLLAGLIMCANWYVEACKWRLLVGQSVSISMRQSVIAVLYGTSLGFITPNRVGDYSGRAQILPAAYREHGVSATVFSSIGQNIPTFLFGAVSFLVLAIDGFVNHLHMVWLLGSAVGFLASFFFACILFRPLTVQRIFSHVRLASVKRYLTTVADRYPQRLLRRILVLSVSRYMIFIVQFWLIARAFVVIDFSQAFVALAATYLTNTIIPSNQLVEFGVRIGVPSFILSYYGIAAEPVAVSAFILWLINLAVPSSIGGFVYRRYCSQENSLVAKPVL